VAFALRIARLEVAVATSTILTTTLVASATTTSVLTRLIRVLNSLKIIVCITLLISPVATSFATAIITSVATAAPVLTTVASEVAALTTAEFTSEVTTVTSTSVVGVVAVALIVRVARRLVSLLLLFGSGLHFLRGFLIFLALNSNFNVSFLDDSLSDFFSEIFLNYLGLSVGLFLLLLSGGLIIGLSFFSCRLLVSLVREKWLAVIFTNFLQYGV
jgi:hypothetical protein